uniref:Vascular endothelial growth factor A n=1 Tax=Leptobrachium leishanense TaxID=445787 RepID=A0A8C5PJC1_9ANUR
MNFLLTWINWGLAIVVSLSTVQVTRTAPTLGGHKPTEGPRDSEAVMDGYRTLDGCGLHACRFFPHAPVVPFYKVFEQSVCKVRETMVDVYQEYPDDVEFIFKPSCVPLMRCSGCCNDETLECVPVETYNITMQIMSIRPHINQNIIDKSFQQHSRCECRLKRDVISKQENHCEPCKERRKHLFVQDPLTCKCSCKYTDSRCKTRQLELNERTCRCEKPRR